MEEPPKEKPDILLWIGIASTVIGSLVALVAFVVLEQPANEQNLWALQGIPLLLLGGLLAFVGVITMLVHGVVKAKGP
jgi:hypothetical protein